MVKTIIKTPIKNNSGKVDKPGKPKLKTEEPLAEKDEIKKPRKNSGRKLNNKALSVYGFFKKIKGEIVILTRDQ
ncbi:hypothetical protein [Pedobacter sp.]